MTRRAVAAASCAIALLIGASVLAPDADTPPAWTEPLTRMELVLVPAQTFEMGTPAGVEGREDQEVLHTVELTRSYYIGRHEVTQGQWERVMGTNPSEFEDCPRCPVERVSYHDVQEFIRRVNERSRTRLRLPTEAEWELACRAGGAGPFGHGSTLSARDANIDGRFPYRAPEGTARNRTTPIGRFAPNPWGIFDMSGNVWEWVEDRHCPYPEGKATDPVGSCESEYRVIRGGSWKFDGNSARCGLRYTHRPGDLGPSLGFRLVRDAN